MEQWQKGIKHTLNYEPGIYGDGVKEIKPITIGMIQTIAKDKRFDINNFNFIVTDECVSGNTLIDTEIGKLPIKNIVEKKMQIKVKTHTGAMKEIKRHHRIRTSKQMVRVVFENDSVECTEDHKILTTGGWKKAKDLLPGRDMVYKHAKKERNI